METKIKEKIVDVIYDLLCRVNSEKSGRLLLLKQDTDMDCYCYSFSLDKLKEEILDGYFFNLDELEHYFVEWENEGQDLVGGLYQFSFSNEINNEEGNIIYVELVGSDNSSCDVRIVVGTYENGILATIPKNEDVKFCKCEYKCDYIWSDMDIKKKFDCVDSLIEL